MYTQFTAAGILAEILNDNAIDATIDTVAAVRDRFVASVRRHVSEHGPFAEIPGAKAFVEGACTIHPRIELRTLQEAGADRHY